MSGCTSNVEDRSVPPTKLLRSPPKLLSSLYAHHAHRAHHAPSFHSLLHDGLALWYVSRRIDLRSTMIRFRRSCGFIRRQWTFLFNKLRDSAEARTLHTSDAPVIWVRAEHIRPAGRHAKQNQMMECKRGFPLANARLASCSTGAAECTALRGLQQRLRCKLEKIRRGRPEIAPSFKKCATPSGLNYVFAKINAPAVAQSPLCKNKHRFYTPLSYPHFLERLRTSLARILHLTLRRR